MKKLLALAVALILCMSSATLVFAGETQCGLPEAVPFCVLPFDLAD